MAAQRAENRQKQLAKKGAVDSAVLARFKQRVKEMQAGGGVPYYIDAINREEPVMEIESVRHGQNGGDLMAGAHYEDDEHEASTESES